MKLKFRISISIACLFAIFYFQNCRQRYSTENDPSSVDKGYVRKDAVGDEWLVTCKDPHGILYYEQCTDKHFEDDVVCATNLQGTKFTALQDTFISPVYKEGIRSAYPKYDRNAKTSETWFNLVPNKNCKIKKGESIAVYQKDIPFTLRPQFIEIVGEWPSIFHYFPGYDLKAAPLEVANFASLNVERLQVGQRLKQKDKKFIYVPGGMYARKTQGYYGPSYSISTVQLTSESYGAVFTEAGATEFYRVVLGQKVNACEWSDILPVALVAKNEVQLQWGRGDSFYPRSRLCKWIGLEKPVAEKP